MAGSPRGARSRSRKGSSVRAAGPGANGPGSPYGRPRKAGQLSDVGRQEPALRQLRRGLWTGREAYVLEQLVAKALVETEDDEILSDRPRRRSLAQPTSNPVEHVTLRIPYATLPQRLARLFLDG